MSTTPDSKTLLDTARGLQPRLVDLRRRIHEEPELGLDTPATRKKILDDLADLDLEIDHHVPSRPPV